MRQTGELVGVRLQPGALKKLGAWHRQEDDLPGRPEAIRRMIERALAKGKAR